MRIAGTCNEGGLDGKKGRVVVVFQFAEFDEIQTGVRNFVEESVDHNVAN